MVRFKNDMPAMPVWKWAVLVGIPAGLLVLVLLVYLAR